MSFFAARLRSICVSATALFFLTSAVSDACTRIVYLGANGEVITARSMDWKTDIKTDLWILPRGIARSGQAGPNSIHWTAKYGSVVASGFDVSTTDGVNEKGLEANLLWLVESKYPTFTSKSKPGLTLAAWAQYMLDNYATVAEAVAALQQEPFTVVTDNVPGDAARLAAVHLSMSDATATVQSSNTSTASRSSIIAATIR